MPKIYPVGESNEARLDPARDLAVKSVEKQLFIEWLSLPLSLREPKTKTEMAKQLGVDRRTLYDWEHDVRVIAQIPVTVIREYTGSDFAETVAAVKAVATDPTNPRCVSAAKLLFDMMEKVTATRAEVPLSEKSLDELRAMVADLYDEVDERNQSA